MKKAVFIVILVLSGFIIGVVTMKILQRPIINDSAIIWSGESQSPDRHFVASAHTVPYGGLGTVAAQTTVYLKQRGQSPVWILGLSYESVYPLGITAVDMTWITPSHLSITYEGHATIDFQAVKCAGVEITIEKKEDHMGSP